MIFFTVFAATYVLLVNFALAAIGAVAAISLFVLLLAAAIRAASESIGTTPT